MISVTATDLHRLMHCMGSRLLPTAIPHGNKEQRDEGNAAHWLAEQMFNGAKVGSGTVAPNGWVVTDDMVDYVEQYVSALDCGEMECDTSYSSKEWEVRGRADHIVFRRGSTPSLTVDDFKYGWRPVSPKENWTLISHAVGYCIRTQERPAVITFRIHQPRPFHADGPLRDWQCTYDQLMGFYARIDSRLSEPDDMLVTDRDICAKCHALATCPAARRASMNAIDAAQLAFNDDLPKDIMTYEYETLERAVAAIENRRDALGELITHRIKQGEVFDGYALERRFGQRRWKPGLSGKALSAVLGVDMTKDSMITPAAAERAGVSKEAVAALVERPTLDPKLKAIDADAKGRAAFGDGS